MVINIICYNTITSSRKLVITRNVPSPQTGRIKKNHEPSRSKMAGKWQIGLVKLININTRT